MQKTTLVTGARGRFAYGRAANHFLDQITLFVYVNLRFVWRAEQVVIVAHHFLVSTDQHEGEIVSLVRIDLVEFQHMLNVMQVDELVDYTVGIAGDVAERGELSRRFIQVLDRHDREQLIERPVIGHGLEY